MASEYKRHKTKFSGVIFRECETNGKPDKVYYIRVKDQTGRSIEKKIGKYSEGIREQYCNIKRNELLTQIRLGETIKVKHAKKNKILFSTLADTYFKTRKDNLTTSKDQNVRKNHLDPYFKTLDMECLTRDHFTDIKNEKLKTLSPKTVNNMLTLLSSILNYAYKYEMLKEDYTRYIKKETIDNTRETFLSVSDVQKLYKAIEDEHKDMLHLFVKIALTTGARLSSILNIAVKDIDFVHNFMTIKDFKNKSTYSAFLNQEVKELIILYIQEHDIQDKLFPVVDTTIQKPLRKIFNRLFNQGLKPNDRKNRVVIHTLRHTFASHLAINGTPIFTIQKLMNHKDIKMTIRYSKLSPDSGRESVAALCF